MEAKGSESLGSIIILAEGNLTLIKDNTTVPMLAHAWEIDLQDYCLLSGITPPGPQLEVVHQRSASQLFYPSCS